jgi:hypothetical protein
MNNVLKREIILHIFKTVGVMADPELMRISMMDQLNSEKFLLDKKIAFETEEKKVKENNLWAATAKIENSSIKIIIADITEDIFEFTLILQMDTFLPCAIRLSEDPEDFGSMYVNIQENKWIEATTSLQAKMLVGFESLTEIYLQWQKLDDYMDVYKSMIGFLNFWEQV